MATTFGAGDSTTNCSEAYTYTPGEGTASRCFDDLPAQPAPFFEQRLESGQDDVVRIA
jgi:hypothetical protein